MKHALWALVLASALPAAAADVQVFQCGGNRYSDTPANMKLGQCSVLNVRTGTVTPPAPAAQPVESMSLADRQAALNADIAAENKRREEEAAKMAAQAKEENCKAARMNLETAEKTNAANKDSLIAKFNGDIAKYCN